MSTHMPGPASLSQMVSPPHYYNKPAFEQHGMQYVRLGQTGAVISRITLGLMSYSSLKEGQKPWFPWILGQEAAEALVQQALDAGITSFDTAETYSDGGSEEFFGLALAKLLPQSRFTRQDLFITTKINPPRTLGSSGFGGLQKGLSRKAIMDAVDGSLRRLQLEHLDLYLVHRFDYNTAIEETMKALHDLVVSGKVRYIGASAMHCWQFAKMQRVAEMHGWTKFSVMQNHYNAIYRGQHCPPPLRLQLCRLLRVDALLLLLLPPVPVCVAEEEREMLPYCIDSGVASTPYSPLASGLLCRQPEEQPSVRSNTDPIQKSKYYKAGDDAVIAAVQAVAKQRGAPPAQVALAWLLAKPGVASPVIGATKQHHIEDAVNALQLKLTEEEIKQIDSDYQPHVVIGPV